MTQCTHFLPASTPATSLAHADATKRPSLRSHQLPLDPQGHPSLQLTAAGLLLPATASAHASTAGCSAALQALEQQQPTSRQQVDSLRAELLQVCCCLMSVCGCCLHSGGGKQWLQGRG